MKIASTEPLPKDAKTTEGPELEKTRRIMNVDQPLHQVVHTSKFLAEDEQDDKPADAAAAEAVIEGGEDEEWSGIGADTSAAAEESMTWEQLMDLHDDPEPKVAPETEELDVEVPLEDDEEDDDDVDIVLEGSEDEAPRKKPAKKGAESKLKRGQFAADEASEDEQPRKKEPRMTTSKAKKTNYYTNANVKNKNKNKKRKSGDLAEGGGHKRRK